MFDCIDKQCVAVCCSVLQCVAVCCSIHCRKCSRPLIVLIKILGSQIMHWLKFFKSYFALIKILGSHIAGTFAILNRYSAHVWKSALSYIDNTKWLKSRPLGMIIPLRTLASPPACSATFENFSKVGTHPKRQYTMTKEPTFENSENSYHSPRTSDYHSPRKWKVIITRTCEASARDNKFWKTALPSVDNTKWLTGWLLRIRTTLRAFASPPAYSATFENFPKVGSRPNRQYKITKEPTFENSYHSPRTCSTAFSLIFWKFSKNQLVVIWCSSKSSTKNSQKISSYWFSK